MCQSLFDIYVSILLDTYLGIEFLDSMVIVLLTSRRSHTLTHGNYAISPSHQQGTEKIKFLFIDTSVF